MTVEAPERDAKDVRAEIDAMLEATRPEPVTDAATLEDMLAEGKEIRRRGRTFVIIPPSLRDLRHVVRLLNLAAEADEEGATRLQYAMAAYLIYVKEPDCLRPATEAELDRCWTPQALSSEMREAMRNNGLQVTETAEGNA